MEKVIFDCDNTMGLPRQEIDDGLTLYYLLGRPDIELQGVTTTFGNGPIDRVYPQTVHMLRELGQDSIPILRGEGQRRSAVPPGTPETEAARFLVEAAAAQPGEITLRRTDQELQVTTLTFANGVIAHHRFVEHKGNRVLVTVSLPGGEIEENARKYPVEQVKGKSKKYSKY